MKINYTWLAVWLLLVFTVNGMLFIGCVMVAHSIPQFVSLLFGELLGALLLFQLLQGWRNKVCQKDKQDCCSSTEIYSQGEPTDGSEYRGRIG